MFFVFFDFLIQGWRTLWNSSMLFERGTDLSKPSWTKREITRRATLYFVEFDQVWRLLDRHFESLGSHVHSMRCLSGIVTANFALEGTSVRADLGSK
jgi:hypothetical protein